MDKTGRHYYESILGAHGWGNRKIEGEKLLDLYMRNSLVIANTWFVKRKSHKISRYGWNGQQESIVDYFLLHKDLHSKITDVKVIPSVSLQSDHRLLVASFKFNKLKALRETRDRKIKVWKLKDEVKSKVFEKIIRQNIPNTDAGTVEEEWYQYKKCMTEAAEKICGRTSTLRRWKETPWWNDKTKTAVLNKNKMFRLHFQQQTDQSKEIYKVAKKEADRVVAGEKEKWMQKWSEKLQEDIDGNKNCCMVWLRTNEKIRNKTSL